METNEAEHPVDRRVVGGVDTHKDLHVAAVVDERGCVLAPRCFASTHHGYRKMLAWMHSKGSAWPPLTTRQTAFR